MLKSYLQDYAYKEHWQVKYNKIEASKIIKKLSRHFKIEIKYTGFTTNKVGWAWYTGHIALPKRNICLGMICHELGHLLAYKNGHRGHNKGAYKYIHRVYRYGIKYIPTKLLLGLDRPQLLLQELK